jgi:hypothetical protein
MNPFPSATNADQSTSVFVSLNRSLSSLVDPSFLCLIGMSGMKDERRSNAAMKSQQRRMPQ